MKEGAMNEITVPAGERISIILSDGTKRLVEFGECYSLSCTI
ncbi:MAG: hypothetical protein ACLU4N_05350 [Butyricimonas faecihominis]